MIASAVRELMAARRAVATARAKANAEAKAAAHDAMDHAKVALGERGSVWRDDQAPDQNRHVARKRLTPTGLLARTDGPLPASRSIPIRLAAAGLCHPGRVYACHRRTRSRHSAEVRALGPCSKCAAFAAVHRRCVGFIGPVISSPPGSTNRMRDEPIRAKLLEQIDETSSVG